MRGIAFAAGLALVCLTATAAQAAVLTMTCDTGHFLIDTGATKRMVYWSAKHTTPIALTKVNLTSEAYEGTTNSANPVTMHIDLYLNALSLHHPDGSVQGPWYCTKDATPLTPPSGAPAPATPPPAAGPLQPATPTQNRF